MKVNIGRVKLILMLALSIHYMMVMAQQDRDLSLMDWNKIAVNDELNLLFNDLVLSDRIIDTNIEGWCEGICPPKRYVGITHIPSADFNIYLAFHNSVTPKITTSFEVSLNYAGVMNIKGLFLLRKRSKKAAWFD